MKQTIVSFSEVYKWQTCRRQYYYNYVLDRRPIEMSEAVTTGIKGHRLLQVFHEFLRDGKTKEEALKLTQEYATELIRGAGFSSKDLLLAWTLVDNYIRATDFTAEAVLVENRFLLPASALDTDPALSHVLIGFTPDVVFERKGDKLDVEDYKFIQRAWPKSKVNRFPQLKLYQIFLGKMNYEISRSILRFFNVKTGIITAQNYILSPEEAKTLTQDFMEGVRELIQYKDGPVHVKEMAPRTMNYGACQFCAFEYPCSLQAEGKSADKTLENMYVKSDYDYTK
jgi:hypothetical protein